MAEQQLCHDLLLQSEQVGEFVWALRGVAGHHEWRHVEPHAAQAWAQISEYGLRWSEIREFVSEAWGD